MRGRCPRLASFYFRDRERAAMTVTLRSLFRLALFQELLIELVDFRLLALALRLSLGAEMLVLEALHRRPARLVMAQGVERFAIGHHLLARRRLLARLRGGIGRQQHREAKEGDPDHLSLPPHQH